MRNISEQSPHQCSIHFGNAPEMIHATQPIAMPIVSNQVPYSQTYTTTVHSYLDRLSLAPPKSILIN